MRARAIALFVLVGACDDDDVVRGAPPLPGASGGVTEPAAAMRKGLVARGADADWFPGDRRGEPVACLLVDNGSEATAKLRLPDDAVFEVAAGARQELCTFTGDLPFAASTSGDGIDLVAPLAEDRLTVFNAGGAWDYAIVERRYSTIAVGPGDARTDIVSTLLFSTAPVDFAFEPLPESFEEEVKADDVLPVRSRRQLDHAGTVHRDRTVTKLAHDTFTAAVVGPDLIAVQSKAPAEITTLFVDNPAKSEFEIAIDGATIGRAPAASFIRVTLPAGSHELTASRDGKPLGDPVKADLQAGARHLFEPSGRQRYAIERVDYGQPIVPTLGTGRPIPIDDKRFFLVDADYVFAPFPATVETAYGLGTQRKRLTRR